MNKMQDRFKRFVALLALAAMVAISGAPSHGATPGPADPCTSPRNDGPLKVFVLAGQSNMQGHAEVRTLGVLENDPATESIFEALIDESGEARVHRRVRISSIGSSEEEKYGALTVGYGASGRRPKIGPELMFGVTMQSLLDEKILLIKTAWGGKSLHTDFRPPSAGPFEFEDAQLERFEKNGEDIDEIKEQKTAATGRYYRMMVEHVHHVLGDIERIDPDYDPEKGYELAGFVWFQGWNDMVDGGVYPKRAEAGGYDAYSELLAHFIRDVRRDLESPGLPFVIGVMGVGGPTDLYGPDQRRHKDVHQNFRDAMAAPAALPEFEDSVTTVLTERFWDLEVSGLRARDRALEPRRKRIDERLRAGELSDEEAKAARAALRANEFTEEELEQLEGSVSNAEYHYLGSARILTRIGAAFAEALFESMPHTDR